MRTTRALGLGVLLACVSFARPARAAETDWGEWSFAVHANAALIHGEGVLGADVAIGKGLLPRFRLELALLAMSNFDHAYQYAAGLRPLLRLGGLLGDVELGAVAYASYGGGRVDDRVSLMVGPHLRYTFTVLSLYYEPLYLTDTDFGDIDSVGDLEASRLVPLRFGIGLEF